MGDGDPLLVSIFEFLVGWCVASGALIVEMDFLFSVSLIAIRAGCLPSSPAMTSQVLPANIAPRAPPPSGRSPILGPSHSKNTGKYCDVFSTLREKHRFPHPARQDQFSVPRRDATLTCRQRRRRRTC